jgi:hypothetical protein
MHYRVEVITELGASSRDRLMFQRFRAEPPLDAVRSRVWAELY